MLLPSYHCHFECKIDVQSVCSCGYLRVALHLNSDATSYLSRKGRTLYRRTCMGTIQTDVYGNEVSL